MKVSVIIPVFNKGKYIREALLSVKSQTYRDWECLVVDNRSTDDGILIANEFENEDERFRILSYTDSQGPGATRNYGVQDALGEWLLFLDADDIIRPEHLSNLLSKSEKADIVAGCWIERNAADSTQDGVKHPPLVDSLFDSSIAFVPWAIHAAIIRKNITPAWPQILDTVLGEDIAFWFEAVRGKRVQYVSSCEAIYRVGTLNCRTKMDDVEKWYEGVDAAIKQNLKTEPNPGPKQCESLVRVYHDLYIQAKAAQSKTVETMALTNANHWLSCCSGQSLSRGIRLRKWLGIPVYTHLTNWVR